MFDSSSKKTIVKILLLYLGTSAIFLCIGFYSLIIKETENIIFSQMSSLRLISFDIHSILRKNSNDLQKAITEILLVTDIPFAIYDRNNKLIYSNLLRNPNKMELERGMYRVNDRIIANPDSVPNRVRSLRGMHSKPLPFKIFLEDDSMDKKIFFMKIKFGLFFVLTLTIIGVIAAILVRIFLKPLNEYIKTLDMFIKDATHEINTPISVILMSIETLKKDHLELEEQKKIDRIKIASLQLNKIYRDLVAHNFPHSLESNNTQLQLDVILKERINFFTPFFIQKNLLITTNIKPVIFNGNKEKITLLFDNLLSNAIKYNSKDGMIEILLEENKFMIKDSGKGINIKDLNKIYERYTRYSTDSGGFGIGLFLVKKICDEYHIDIDIKTDSNGTIFNLIWGK